MKKIKILRISLVIFIVVLIGCVGHSTKDRLVLRWKITANKYDEPIYQIDTLTTDSLNLELVGRLKRANLDSILKTNVKGENKKVSDFNVFIENRVKEQLNDDTIDIFNLYIENIINGRFIHILYNEDYGILIKEYSDVLMCLEKITKVEKDENIVYNLSDFSNKLLGDTILFPLPPPAPPVPDLTN